METKNNGWLCRHCGIGINNNLDKCPICGAERPVAVESEEGEEVIVIEEATKVEKGQTKEAQKNIYIFRELVLVNGADILFILGSFCSFAALIAPHFLDDNAKGITILSIVSCVAIFCGSLLTWALFRNIAEISRMLRNREEKEQKY